MPAYFSINITVKNNDIYDGMYADFLNIIQKEGLNFVSGSWEFIDEPLDKIIEWNEAKISQRFALGKNEHNSNNYRQIFLDYHGFSEVRLFIIYDKQHEELVFTIIIPEDELLKLNNGAVVYDPAILKDLRTVITNIWNWNCVSAIQTTLELSGDIKHIDELENGEIPSTVPFAVIPKAYVNYDFGVNDKVTDISRNGILIECE